MQSTNHLETGYVPDLFMVKLGDGLWHCFSHITRYLGSSIGIRKGVYGNILYLFHLFLMFELMDLHEFDSIIWIYNVCGVGFNHDIMDYYNGLSNI